MVFEIADAPPCITLDGPDRQHDYLGEHEETRIEGQSEVSHLPAVLRGLDVSKVETRTDFVRELNRTLPLNEYNLPIYVYRPDLLDPKLLTQSDRSAAKSMLADMLTNSITYLSYDHGFPTIIEDRPFWGQMPWESRDAFAGFLQYLDIPGARSLHKIPNITPDLLVEWFHQNCWSHRATAYDAFRVAHHARLREQRLMGVQDSQFRMTENLLAKVNKALEDKTDDDFKLLEFDKLVNSFDKLAKAQREVVGMSSGGGIGKDGLPLGGTSVEVVMRKVADSRGQIKTINNDLVDMEALLADPAALESAQELIIKVNSR